MTDPVIKPKGNLKKLQLENQLVMTVKNEINAMFPDLSSVKLDIDIVLQICNAIETQVKIYNLKNVNKLDLFFRVYTYCFGVVDDKERQFLTKIIEHLHMSNRIKALSYLKRIMRFVKQFFLKKKK